MTAPNRFDRMFADALADRAEPSYPDYIEHALDRATRRSQRPVWTFPERWLPMSTIARTVPLAPGLPWRNIGLLAILALLAATILVVAIGTQPRPAPPYGPARNGQIVYQVGGDIYTQDLLGGKQRLIVGGPQTDVYPVFSRDGTKLAFFRLDAATEGTVREKASLIVANPDGSGSRALVGPAVVASLAWSPNSQELALVTLDGGQKLLIVPVDGTTPRVLDVGLPISEGLVTWRPPDGRELIFRTPGGDTNRFHAIRGDGTGLRQITPDGISLPFGGGVSLTPDGRLLTYMHMRAPYSIRIVDLETGQERRFGERLPALPTDGTRGGPIVEHAGGQQVSADGTKLVFGRYWDERRGRINNGLISPTTAKHQVWIASLAGDGSDAQRVGPIVESAAGRDAYLVLPAPDGSRIVVHRLESTETWSTDFSGGDPRRLDLGYVYEMDWQRMAP